MLTTDSSQNTPACDGVQRLDANDSQAGMSLVSPSAKVNLCELSLEELTEFAVSSLGEAPFRARQLWQWIWRKRARSFDTMTDLSRAVREKLEEKACIIWPEIEKVQQSKDGTVKFLLRLADGELIETVLIPSESRHGKKRMTQCLSCQVGCSLACTFCSTGTLGLTRNMTAGEILGQVLVAREYLNDDPNYPILKNIVFMGMGEPLLNFNAVKKSLITLNDEHALGFSARRVTVSTSGIKKNLLELGESGLAYLAVSLHAPTQELRETIMPKASRWPLDELINTLCSYPLKTRERLTFEYLLLGGVNDSVAHARQLAKIMSRIKGKLNIIVYNSSVGSPYKAPRPEQVELFQNTLKAKGIIATLRKSKGQDIDAACGQLKANQVAC